MLIPWEVGVAIYAAVVATGALFLEIRRWVESGVLLTVEALPDRILINVPGAEGKEYISVTVINRGSAPTTITNLYVYVFDTWWQRLRCRPARAAVVANPGVHGEAGRLPKFLGPGAVWQGFGTQDETLTELIGQGHLYVALFASHSDRPLLRRVRVPPKPPEGAEEI